ncbi:MAG: hypothetical protein K2W95_29550 [Candidatus Obscuribacterales bacterium]|nr:hypothetical protein [Candidatus Obscuribacterales bacterium]
MTDISTDKLETVSNDKQTSGFKVEDLLTNPNFSTIFQREKQPVIVCGDPNKNSSSKASLYLEFVKIPQFIDPLVSPKWDQKPSQEILDALKAPPVDIGSKPGSSVEKISDLLNQSKNGGDRCEPGRSPEPAPSAPGGLQEDIPNAESAPAGPPPRPIEISPIGPSAVSGSPSDLGSVAGHGREPHLDWKSKVPPVCTNP